MTSSIKTTGKKRLSTADNPKKYEVLYLERRIIGTSNSLVGAKKLIDHFIKDNNLRIDSCSQHFIVRMASPTYKLVVKTTTSLTLIK